MLIVISSIIIIIAGVLFIYGTFKPMTLYKQELKRPVLLYYSWKGPKDKLMEQIKKLNETCSQYFKLSDLFGIYYSLPDKQIWDCALGILVNLGEQHKCQDFLGSNPQFKIKKLKSIDYVGSYLPYINPLSFMLMPLKIPQYIDNLKKEQHPIFPGVIQLYKFNFSPKRIQFINPLHSHEQLMLFQEQ